MKTIYVDKELTQPVSPLLTNLPDVIYQVTKVSTLEGRDGISGINQDVPFEGRIQVIANREGGPNLVVGRFPYGGMATSQIAGVEETEGGVLLITRNSKYLIEKVNANEEYEP